MLRRFFSSLYAAVPAIRSLSAPMMAARSGRRRVDHLIIIATALLPTAAAAIVTRHDVPDAAYERKAADLPSYCMMMAPDGGGALIAPI